MKNIHVIPTGKPSRIRIGNNGNFVFGLTQNSITSKNDSYTNQNIYITSDEEIKEGTIVKIPCGVGKVKELHWKYGNDNPSYIIEDLFVYKLRYGQKEGELQTNSFRYEDVKKIILTTDQDLIKDGIQAIDDEFLEWFVKNPSCEEVEVAKEMYIPQSNGKISDGRISHELSLNQSDNTLPFYKIIIPQEEPKELPPLPYEYKPEDCLKETLEEAAEKWVFETNGHKWSNNDDSAGDNYSSFKAGVKWQEERTCNHNYILTDEQGHRVIKCDKCNHTQPI
jgi:hypothetical protein